MLDAMTKKRARKGKKVASAPSSTPDKEPTPTVEAGTVSQVKRKRMSRDAAALSASAAEQRYQHTTLTHGGQGHMLAGSKARSDPQSTWPSNHAKAVSAAVAGWTEYSSWKESGNIETCTKTGVILHVVWDRSGEDSRQPLGAGMSSARKYAIQYYFIEQFGGPPEQDWEVGNFHPKFSLPTIIMGLLNISDNSRPLVVIAMQAILVAHEAGEAYDPSAAIKAGRGAKVLIEDRTDQAEVVYRCMGGGGMSLGSTVVFLNQWRRVRIPPLPPISYGALQRFVHDSPVMKLAKTDTIKSGSSDLGTAWAQARKAFAEQLVRQFAKGRRIQAGGPAYVEAEDGPKDQADLERPIFRGAVTLGDEVIGPAPTRPPAPYSHPHPHTHTPARPYSHPHPHPHMPACPHATTPARPPTTSLTSLSSTPVPAAPPPVPAGRGDDQVPGADVHE